MDIDNVLLEEIVHGDVQRVDIQTSPQEIFELLLKYKGIPQTPKIQELFSQVLAQYTESTPHEDI